jgi:hypothetical protein
VPLAISPALATNVFGVPAVKLVKEVELDIFYTLCQIFKPIYTVPAPIEEVGDDVEL